MTKKPDKFSGWNISNAQDCVKEFERSEFLEKEKKKRKRSQERLEAKRIKQIQEQDNSEELMELYQKSKTMTDTREEPVELRRDNLGLGSNSSHTQFQIESNFAHSLSSANEQKQESEHQSNNIEEYISSGSKGVPKLRR